MGKVLIPIYIWPSEWKVVLDSPLNNIHSGVVILAGSGMLSGGYIGQKNRRW
jgi:hypothetical protein